MSESVYYLKYPIRLGSDLVAEVPIKAVALEDLGALTELRDAMTGHGAGVSEAALAALRVATGLSDFVLKRLNAHDVGAILQAYAGQVHLAARTVARPKWQH